MSSATPIKLTSEELAFLRASLSFAIDRLKKRPTSLFAKQVAAYRQSPGEFLDFVYTIQRKLGSDSRRHKGA